jgi:hypothetical protein
MRDPLEPLENGNLRELLANGGKAAEILAGDVFEAAIMAPELDSMLALFRTQPEEWAERERLYQEVRQLRRVRRRLTNARAKGIAASKKLSEREEKETA